MRCGGRNGVAAHPELSFLVVNGAASTAGGFGPGRVLNLDCRIPRKSGSEAGMVQGFGDSSALGCGEAWRAAWIWTRMTEVAHSALAESNARSKP